MGSGFKVLQLESSYSQFLILLVKSLKILSVSSAWSQKNGVVARVKQRKSCKSPSSDLASAFDIDKLEKRKSHSRSNYSEHTQLHIYKTSELNWQSIAATVCTDAHLLAPIHCVSCPLINCKGKKRHAKSLKINYNQAQKGKL